MAEEPVYNLLQAIDPSKIKVPISERFCKLTLSSNKKKKEPDAAKEETLVREKRDSASRNLLKQLSQQQESNNSSSSPLQHTNPLLRSDSSQDHNDQRDKSHLGEYYETTMDSLNVTEDESDDSTEMEHLDIDSLTQKVSAFSVVCRQPTSLSSSSADPLSEVTQLVSTESQRSSMGEIQKFHNIEEVPVKIYKREIIAISSSSSSGQGDRDYQITDDEDEVLEEEKKVETDMQESDEDEYEEDEVITISDSSVSVPAEEQTEMGVSTIRTIQEAGEWTIREFREQLQLPLPTLSPEKMERVAAFLRDVSIEQRNRAECCYSEAEDSICSNNLPPDEIKTLGNEKELATADTESMTPEDDDKEDTPEAIRERERRLKALEEKKEDSEESPETRARQLAKAETQDNSTINDVKYLEKTPQNRERRLVSADTVQNSTISDIHEDKEKEDTPEAIRERQRRLKALEEKKEDSEESPEAKASRLAKADKHDYSTINDTPQNRERRLVSADTVENSTISDIQCDSSMSLQVTPTPKLVGGEVKLPICADTVENILMTQLSGLHLKSPISPKTPQTIKRSDNDISRHGSRDTQPTELNYFSPRTQKTPKSITKINKDIRRIQSAETQDNTSPSSSSNYKSPRRLASADTVANTINTDKSPSAPETPQSSKRYPKDVHRIVSAETEENTLKTVVQTSSTRPPPYSPKSPRRAQRRLVSADTEENTMSDLQLSNSITSHFSPRKSKQCHLTSDDTEANTHLNNSLTPETYHPLSVPPSNPIYITTPQKDSTQYRSNISLNSVISCSSEEQRSESAPEHSITILETDDEDSAKSLPSPKSPQSDVSNKLSSSFRDNEQYVDDAESRSSSSMTQIQMSMANINISAKINIKITIPDSTETSGDDESSSSQHDEDEDEETDSHGKQLNSSRRNAKLDLCSSHPNDELNAEEGNHSNDEEIILDSDKSNGEDDKFVDAAAKLLTQLYGNAWQTPDVIRTLRKTSESDDKKVRTPANITKRNQKDNVVKNTSSKVVEESVLGDFSMFRRNIVKTNFLDSTRLYTPNPKSTKGLQNIKECLTEPRNKRKGFEKDCKFVVPQSEIRAKSAKTPMTKISADQIRSQNEKWRQLVDNDSDSECKNASDDDDADRSDDESWKGSGLESNDSDFEISPEKRRTKKGAVAKDYKTKSKKDNKFNDANPADDRFGEGSDLEGDDSDYDISPRKSKANPNRKAQVKKNATSKTNNSNKNRNNSNEDDIVYLDLSKEEVEVQDDVPQSPPANHDVTFASRLNEILKTCRHENKPKLPSSAHSNSKRKLFTPNFGADLEAELPSLEMEEKENNKGFCDENGDGLVLDDGICPFDARGKPKKLQLFNKPLEAVKVGKPVFQLTPSPKKITTPLRRALQGTDTDSTPNSKTKQHVKNKTPSTARKEVPNSIAGIIKTPDYKYSFLKSLDATVSNDFCHPEARVYRDSYRTKKEDLSRLLYQLYNEKLFCKSLDVPIKWNKKLLNTAGRCLNKKKFGTRSSVIELSEKVLTSADRLRCTLIHELCHAATWIFNGEGGHGKTWKDWAYRANATFPELPKIGVCHQYEIEYKYTYKCTLCAAKSYAHSKSKKVDNIRCSYCHGAIEIFLNKKDKDGNIMATPVRMATGFAKFVKDNYKNFKRDDRKHADVMKLLSSEFAALKLTKNDK